MGQGVYKNYGVASEGFDICSIQFAIHYMFENQETLHNFLRNVSEVTKEGGYFIGTCYNGQNIFNEFIKTCLFLSLQRMIIKPVHNIIFSGHFGVSF